MCGDSKSLTSTSFICNMSGDTIECLRHHTRVMTALLSAAVLRVGVVRDVRLRKCAGAWAGVTSTSASGPNVRRLAMSVFNTSDMAAWSASCYNKNLMDVRVDDDSSAKAKACGECMPPRKPVKDGFLCNSLLHCCEIIGTAKGEGMYVRALGIRRQDGSAHDGASFGTSNRFGFVSVLLAGNRYVESIRVPNR